MRDPQPHSLPSPRCCPNGRSRFRGAASLAAPDPLGRALAETLRAAVDEQPVVIAVDDAQWLDQDSALSLGAMLRDLAATPLTLVLAIAPYPPSPELDELRSRSAASSRGRRCGSGYWTERHSVTWRSGCCRATTRSRLTAWCAGLRPIPLACRFSRWSFCAQ